MRLTKHIPIFKHFKSSVCVCLSERERKREKERERERESLNTFEIKKKKYFRYVTRSRKGKKVDQKDPFN
jgi:hypothetical protein